jgi:hypothetical protein
MSPRSSDDDEVGACVLAHAPVVAAIPTDDPKWSEHRPRAGIDQGLTATDSPATECLGEVALSHAGRAQKEDHLVTIDGAAGGQIDHLGAGTSGLKWKSKSSKVVTCSKQARASRGSLCLPTRAGAGAPFLEVDACPFSFGL